MEPLDRAGPCTQCRARAAYCYLDASNRLQYRCRQCIRRDHHDVLTHCKWEKKWVGGDPWNESDELWET